ncbi:ribosomal protein L7/L12 [Bacillus sp. WLY-B-L8]|uniref:ribosomal protein L7/L12 n=1 Tax=Bacillus multifaciens TaxID=3068506 RepID=UPI0027422D19|nr:ribosomal protein L7/L12 [Bacillus sp. WLY-B-L8]MDP7981096.1 ribosomal protein L7/L12 [Bacillus sp. WLY-B-L8]
MDYLLLTAVIVLGIFYISGQLNNIHLRLKRTEDKLDRIAKHMELPEHTINEELRLLVKDGDKIKAIKKAREVLGLSLLEAKNYVDSL